MLLSPVGSPLYTHYYNIGQLAAPLKPKNVGPSYPNPYPQLRFARMHAEVACPRQPRLKRERPHGRGKDCAPRLGHGAVRPCTRTSRIRMMYRVRGGCGRHVWMVGFPASWFWGVVLIWIRYWILDLERRAMEIRAACCSFGFRIFCVMLL
jgi:hypothetical protein